jgi:hypothetical protein
MYRLHTATAAAVGGPAFIRGAGQKVTPVATNGVIVRLPAGMS